MSPLSGTPSNENGVIQPGLPENQSKTRLLGENLEQRSQIFIVSSSDVWVSFSEQNQYTPELIFEFLGATQKGASTRSIVI